MDSVFLVIRRQKTNIFTDAKETTGIYEIKRTVEAILKVAPEDQKLYEVKDNQEMRELSAVEEKRQLEEHMKEVMDKYKRALADMRTSRRGIRCWWTMPSYMGSINNLKALCSS